jgi:CHAD domain-containing protein
MSETIRAGSSLTVAQAAAEVAGEQARELRRHARKVRTGRDPEAVHQMRVATRRLRAMLRIFSAHLVVPGRVRRGLRRLARRLGAVRDRDVLIALLDDHHLAALQGQERRRAASLLAAWRRARARARRALSEEIGRKRFARLLEALVAYGKEPHPAGDPAAQAARVLEEAVEAQAAALGRHRAMLEPAPPPEALHDLRIAFKRLRYTLDFHAAAFGLAYDVERRLARRMQEVLGEIHDRDLLLDLLAWGKRRFRGSWPALHPRLAAERQVLVRRFLKLRREWLKRTAEAPPEAAAPRYASLEPARVTLRLVAGRGRKHAARAELA